VTGAAGNWNFADIWEVVADHQPNAPAVVQGGRRLTWRELDRRADGIAAGLLAAGLGHQDKVAQYLTNCPEFLETLFATFKAALVPVNTNFRYRDDELVQLWDDADVVAVVFHGTFTPTVDRVRSRVPRVRLWLWVDDGTEPCPPWAVDLATLADAPPAGRTVPPWGRSGDDLYLLYTGGTTGLPKGVMWRQDDVVMAMDAPAKDHLPLLFDREAVAAKLRPGLVVLPAAPLIHGTSSFNTMNAMNAGACVVLLEQRSYDPVELLDAVQREGVRSLFLVGDVFAKPLVDALDREPGRWDLSSLRLVFSSGVTFSQATKERLLRHNPALRTVDALGSSEVLGAAQSVSSAGATAATGSFRLAPGAKVLTEDGREVQPGSGEAGRMAFAGRVPLGYYKDPVKSAATFPVYDGVRYSVPGDWVQVEADGTLTFLGRGSLCINTGGEKVFPEEVEEALRTHPGVADAAVVGVPDERFGQAVCAVVEAAVEPPPGEDELRAHVRGQLAGYKVPKRVVFLASLGRGPNGKLDYRRLADEALRRR